MHAVKSVLREIAEGGDPGPALREEIFQILQKAAGSIRAKAGLLGTTTSLPHETAQTMTKDIAVEQIITRHRFDTRRRILTVREKTNLTPQMIRFVLTGDDLADFESLAPDDHIKLFLDTGAGKTEMRDYTPRAFDREKGTLTLDFAIHEAGPATQWAIEAEVGSTLTIGGPRGSAVIAPVFDWYLLVGDETALPAIGRWVEEMPAGKTVVTLGIVTGSAEEQGFTTAADHQAHWVHRTDSSDAAGALAALDALTLPEGRGFVWIAAEAGVARALRDHMLNERQHPREALKASGYWVRGQADAHEKLMD